MDSFSRKSAVFCELFARAKKVYHCSPRWLQWPFWPLRTVLRLLDTLRPNVWIVAGNEISTGQELTLLYAGHEVHKNLWIRLAFGSHYEQTHTGRRWLWNILAGRDGNGPEHSLTIVEVFNSLRRFCANTGFLWVPYWITAEFDLPMDRSTLLKQRNTSLKSDLSKIRKNRFHFEVTCALPELRSFYDNMYVPYAVNRYGNTANITPYREIEKGFVARRCSGELLLIKKEGEIVAGVVLGYKGKTAKLHHLGLKDGDARYVRDGAIGAMFYFSVCYLEEKGLKRLSLGESRPFLRDGPLQFKRKWSPQISSQNKKSFLIRPFSQAAGVRGFFENNPLIFEDEAGLYGAIFVGRDEALSSGDITRLYRDYSLKGMSKLAIYRFGTAPCDVPAELSDQVEIHAADAIFPRTQ